MSNATNGRRIKHAEPILPGSVTCQIGQLRGGKEGSEKAASFLYDLYHDRLTRLAIGRLQGGFKGRAVYDGEDAAVDALASFFARVSKGEFPGLDNRTDLWSLLATLTIRKALDQLEREGRLKRGGGNVLRECDLMADSSAGATAGLEHVAGREDDPALVAALKEEEASLLARLGDPILQKIVALRVQGNTVKEIAEELGSSERTIHHRLQLIRLIWMKDA